MMKYLNLIVFLTWLCFMACDNEINPLQPQAEEAYIRFDVIEEEWPTKGTTTDGTSIRNQSLGVLAYNITGSNTMESSTPSLMYNIPVSIPDGSTAWTYSEAKRWPTSGTVNFFAYTPYDDMTGTGVAHFKLSDKSATGYPSITYRMNDQSNNHSDLLVASVMDRTKEGGVVPFKFKHALARIHFTAKLKEDCTYSNVQITQVSIKSSSFKNVGTLTFTETEGGFNWDNLYRDISTDILMSSDELNQNSLKTDDYVSVTKDDKGYLFLIPQTTALALKVYYTFTDGNGISQSGISLCYLPSKNFQAEKAYNCQFELNPQPMTDGIPGEYTALDALKNNSNGYILLGISPNGNDMGVKMRIQYNGSSDTDVYPLGVLSTLENENETSSNRYSRRFYFPANNSFGFQCGWNNKYGVICSNISGNVKHDISYNYKNDKKIWIDRQEHTQLISVKTDGESVPNGITTEVFFAPVIDSNLPICLFGLTTSVSESGTTYTINKNWHGTIYEVWISKGPADILHLIPVKHNDTYGMYDVIGNDFYPCNNSSSFEAIAKPSEEGTTE